MCCGHRCILNASISSSVARSSSETPLTAIKATCINGCVLFYPHHVQEGGLGLILPSLLLLGEHWIHPSVHTGAFLLYSATSFNDTGVTTPQLE